MKYLDEAKIINALKLAQDKATHRVLKKAVSYSMGRMSYEKLAKLDHPYAVRHGFNSKVPYGDSAKINMHSRVFMNSWGVTSSRLQGNYMKSGIVNSAPYAILLIDGIQGLTIPRPILERCKKQANYWFPIEIRQGIKDALKQY